VTTLLLNTDRSSPANVRLRGPAARAAGVYTVTADLGAEQVALNGKTLELGAGGELPRIPAAPVSDGTVTIPPASYAFASQPRASGRACAKRP
jgi:hypothetical protein